MRYHTQHLYEIKCEWGLHGIEALRDETDVFIIVDVLSFSTAVNVALERQAVVFPYPYKDDNAAVFARERNALLADHRSASGGFSLSPASLQKLPLNSRIVLPSPNGSTLSLATGDKPTFAGCLRNAQAVAETATRYGKRISVIPAGERWPDGLLRPSLEDWLGAGAILSALDGRCSPEAELAKTTFQAVRERLTDILNTCVSGYELHLKDHPDDVRLSAELNVNAVVPLLRSGMYSHQA